MPEKESESFLLKPVFGREVVNTVVFEDCIHNRAVKMACMVDDKYRGLCQQVFLLVRIQEICLRAQQGLHQEWSTPFDYTVRCTHRVIFST